MNTIETAHATSNKEKLLEIKRKCLEIELPTSISQYENKRNRDSIQQLLDFLERKIGLSDQRVPFQFVGDPIPQNCDSKQTIKMINTNHVQLGPGIKNQNYVIQNSTCYLKNISESLIQTTKTNTKIKTKINKISFDDLKLISGINGKDLATNLASPVHQIHIESASDSVFDIVCEGPVFVEDAQNVILIVQCHQLRLKNIVNSTVIARPTNDRFIVEACQNVKVGKFLSSSFPNIDDFSDPSHKSSIVFDDTLSMYE